MTNQEMIDGVARGLGALVWWDLSGTRIRPHELREIFREEGEDPDQVPDVDDESAFRRAAREFRHEDPLGRQYRAEVVADDPGHMVAGVLTREEVADEEVRWRQVATVTLDAQGPLTLDGGDPAAELASLVTDRMRHLDHRWIRPWIKDRLAGMASFRLRRQGGVYYVPVQHEDELDRLGRVVRRIGQSRLHVVHVSDTASSRETIGGGAQRTMADAVGAVREKVERWREQARRAPRDAVERAIGDFDELKARAELYEDALQISLEDLRGEIDRADEVAREMLTDEEVPRAYRPPSDLICGRWRDLVAAHDPDGEGLREVGPEGLAAAGHPKSVWEQGEGWQDGGYHRQALADLGLVGEWERGDDPRLTLRPMTDDEARAPDRDDPAEEGAAADEPDDEVRAAVAEVGRPLDEMTWRDLRDVAKRAGLQGYGQMNKAELRDLVAAAC